MPSPTCDDHQIERLLADDLTVTERRMAEDHLDSCESCRSRLHALAATPELWGEVRSILSDPSLAGDLSASDADPFPARIDARMILNWLAPTDDPEMIGRLGPYEIQGMIGSGGMGVVLKGWDRALRRFVAIKLLAPHLASSDAARQRFLRESRAAAAVVHENVVAIHGVAESEGLPYFVMPYSRGESLQKRLDRAGPLAVEEILRIALQTARGLAAAHAQGLVHRDVKPANILLDEGVERVLLTDFGLARAVDDATLTRSGVIAGTPQYMSPEQIRAEGVDTRSDLFSIGATIYAMCTGKAPFRADSTYAILRQITDNDPLPVAEANPEIPEWLGQIVARLMAKHPEDRFANARELADLLEACLANLERSPEMPLSESAFESYGIVNVVLEDYEDDTDIWPGKLLDHLTGAYAGRFREFVRSKGGMAVGMITLMTLALAGFVIGTEAPDVAGTWHGDDWGTVRLESKAPGTLEGTFEDTVNGQPGKLKLQWSRVERRFVGDWREGDDRFGKISVRLDGDTIRGAITTDPASKVNPGTPQLADLAWFRGKMADVVAGDKSSTVNLAFRSREKSDHAKNADLDRFQGTWDVVEARFSGKRKGDQGNPDTVELKKVRFEGDSVTFDARIQSDDKVREIKNREDFDIIVIDRRPDESVEGKIVLIAPKSDDIPVADIDFQILNDEMKLIFEAKPDDKPGVNQQYLLRRLEAGPLRKATIDPFSRDDSKAEERFRTTRDRFSTDRRQHERDSASRRYATATIAGVQVDNKPADVAIVEGVTVTGNKAADTVAIARVGKPADDGFSTRGVIADQATARVESDVPATATITAGSAAGEDATARITTVSPDSKPAIVAGRSGRLLTETVAGSSLKAGEAVVGSNLSRASDVLFLNIPRQFPEDYSVVYSNGLKVTKPTVTIKARWAEGDTETIRTINVTLSNEKSTAIVRLEPIRTVELTDGGKGIQVGDPKAERKFSLMQFELLTDNVIQVKCWAEKPENAESAAVTAPSLPGSTTIRAKASTANSEAKAISGVTIEATGSASASASADSTKSKSDGTAAASTAEAKPAETSKKP
ncbi:protein kinase [bacterium]|nr:protein kinase [bacterium]